RQALQAMYRYNFRRNMHGHTQIPRRYVPDDEGGLLMCSWPQGGRPNPFIVYADEVWTGIEYAVAGLMLWEGMVQEAVEIVNTARSRYDGRRRDGLDSGPGGNPFNELECGKFYARAMSSFGMLLAAQGVILDTPAGVLGFAPRWQPEDHRSFFITGTGWGLFTQKREQETQREEIHLRYGYLRLRELVFQLPEGTSLRSAAVRIHASEVPTSASARGHLVVLRLAQEQHLRAPAQVVVQLKVG
ncbi:MAG: glycoside hydrolase family 116 protein, partial [Armatimonadetes bacterium]|nr:glycoside hydrolase family 116 protein [Armatimonadota bacterium]